MGLQQEIKDADNSLFALTCRKIAEKRAGMTQNVAWSGPDVTRTKRGAGKVWFESKPITPEKPVKKIVPISIDNTEIDEIEQPHADDPREVGYVEPLVAGQEDIEDAAQEEENDMNSEFERGDGQSDAMVTDSGECE